MDECNAAYYEAKAAQCRRAARTALNPASIASLIEQALTYEAIAAKLREKDKPG
jgi:hypothetical protein